MIFFYFCDYIYTMIQQNLLTELHKGTEFYFCSIQVISTEGNMPWHGDLRAETGIFYFAELKCLDDVITVPRTLCVILKFCG